MEEDETTDDGREERGEGVKDSGLGNSRWRCSGHASVTIDSEMGRRLGGGTGELGA